MTFKSYDCFYLDATPPASFQEANHIIDICKAANTTIRISGIGVVVHVQSPASPELLLAIAEAVNDDRAKKLRNREAERFTQ
ncbi:hypothetical protein [Labrys okinawensis]|uniref:hypothetical protein n=1 Tax=Labrys okinawensis TaxID=346911 RepID=UPI0011B22201|nr:hypothetical protein [Labrys okinawensis]